MQQLTVRDVKHLIEDIQAGRSEEERFRFDIAGTMWTIVMTQGREEDPFLQEGDLEHQVEMAYHIGTAETEKLQTATFSSGDNVGKILGRTLARFPISQLRRDFDNGIREFGLYGDDRTVEEWSAVEIGDVTTQPLGHHTEEYDVGPAGRVALAELSVEMFGLVFDIEVGLRDRGTIEITLIDPNGYRVERDTMSLPPGAPQSHGNIEKSIYHTALEGVNNYIGYHPEISRHSEDSFPMAEELQFHR